MREEDAKIILLGPQGHKENRTALPVSPCGGRAVGPREIGKASPERFAVLELAIATSTKRVDFAKIGGTPKDLQKGRHEVEARRPLLAP